MKRRQPNPARAHWEPSPNPSGDEELAVLASALGHPARVAVVRYLKERGRSTVGDLVDYLGICQGTTSYHLNVLETAKLLRCQEDRPRMWYSVQPDRLERLSTLLKTL